jgi:glutathione S-transferase
MILFLGSRNYSSWSLRAWLVMRHSGLRFQAVTVDLEDPRALAAVSPTARVPVLRDGELLIWESLAIFEYLAERVPTLWPAETAAKAVARAVSQELHSGFLSLRSELPFNLRRPPQPVTLSVPAQAEVARIRSLLTDCRARFGHGRPFLFGAFSIADAMYAPLILRLDSYAIPVGAALDDYAQAIRSWPAVKEWVAAAHAESHQMPRFER